MSFRSEASAPQFIIPREARNPGFNTFSTLRFLTEPVLRQILQSLRSFRMTERRVRNAIFSYFDTVSEKREAGEGAVALCAAKRLSA